MAYGTINADLMTTSDGVSSSGLYGFKNRIYNGQMQIDQRNAGAAVVSAAGYTLDRWILAISSTGTVNVQQDSTAPAGFTKSLKVTVTATDTISGTEYVAVRQKIEGYNIADLGWGTANAQTVTLSFWVRSSITGTFGGVFTNSAQNRIYTYTYTISSADTFEYKTVTITGDTTGTWQTTNSTGIDLWFSLGVGSTYSGTAGSWSSSFALSATGATSIMATNGATFYITGVQLEKGSTATSFDYRPYGTELQLCQRYYQTYGIGNGVGTNTQRCISAANNSGNLIGTWSFIQNMRAAPSATVYGSGTTTGNLVVNYSASSQAIAANTAVTFSSLSVNGWMFNMGSTITANITNWIDMGTATNAGAFTFSAEL